MDKQEIISRAVEAAKIGIIRDDICARSVMIGLKSVFDWIPEEMVTATLSLAGGTGSASGSCGAFCCGLMGVGLKYNATLAEEQADKSLQARGAAKFCEYRDRFLKEMGTIMCPDLQEKIFGRRYDLVDPKEQQEFLTLPGHQNKCAEVVAVATRIAAEMILEGEE